VLKAQKEYVGEMVKELDARGRDLSRRYETITLQTTLLSSLPPQIDELDRTLGELRKQNRSAGNDTSETNPEMALPLPATLQLVEERKARLEEVNRQLKSLQQAVPRQTRALEGEERELRKLEGERERAVLAAKEAVERKREGGGADELEMRGRWLRGVDGVIRGMLEVEG
jgi:chromosome segregation ATPase